MNGATAGRSSPSWQDLEGSSARLLFLHQGKELFGRRVRPDEQVGRGEGSGLLRLWSGRCGFDSHLG